MPPRRSHKKSRAGCRRCKSRKIKCDEVHPRCGNCLKHGVACDFQNPDIVEDLVATASAPSPAPPAPASTTVSAADASTPASSPTIPSLSDLKTPSQGVTSPALSFATPLYTMPSTPTISTKSPTNRLLELRLMHQYTSMTSRTLVVNSPITDDIWQNTVPRLAFSGANYLADAMLAIPHRGAALAFPATVSKRFLDLIEARRPRALVVLACFFACLKSIENVWWLHGAARREVMGIVSQFEAASPWWAHLEWPVRIALYDGAVIPPDVWGADWVTEEGKTDKSSTMLNETFVNHIEILAGMLAKAQSLPPIPIPSDAVLG
ncbi:hypothetical protein BN1708_006724, partial [Verticillium longisporum]